MIFIVTKKIFLAESVPFVPSEYFILGHLKPCVYTFAPLVPSVPPIYLSIGKELVFQCISYGNLGITIWIFRDKILDNSG